MGETLQMVVAGELAVVDEEALRDEGVDDFEQQDLTDLGLSPRLDEREPDLRFLTRFREDLVELMFLARISAAFRA
jgi:hypothetical protein